MKAATKIPVNIYVSSGNAFTAGIFGFASALGNSVLLPLPKPILNKSSITALDIVVLISGVFIIGLTGKLLGRMKKQKR